MRHTTFIFDLDGTLYDKSRLAFRLILSETPRGKLKLLSSERKVRSLLKGKDFGTSEAFYEAFFEALSKESGKKAEAARKWYFEGYLPRMAKILKEHYRLQDWVEPLLKEIVSKGGRLAVFSDYGAVKEKLDALGLDPEIPVYLFDAPSLGGLKPSRASFERLAAAMGARCDDCVMIGDRNDTDGSGARAAGMDFIQVTSRQKEGPAKGLL